MASIVVFSCLLTSSLVYFALAQKNETVTTVQVNMKCRCKAVIGLKTVNIIWVPLSQDGDSSFESSYYRVSYSTDRSLKPEHTRLYQSGCTLNTTRQSSLQKELRCSITSQTIFPLSFYFIVEMANSSGVYNTARKTCRLVDSVHCTKPPNFRVTDNGKRNISVSWDPAPDMGDLYTPLLCYRIHYASAQDKTNESVEINNASESPLVHTFSDLIPYMEYRFFIQCSFVDCTNGWGALSGPVMGMTKEEVPTRAPQFENWSVSNTESDKRNVTVVWKLPPSNTWNGVLKKFDINFWQVLSQENDSLTPIPNSSRSLQIKNGSVKKATLPGLNRFADYQSEISMCTAEGCGPRSNPWLFRGDAIQDMKLNKAQSNEFSASFIWIIVGTLGGVAFIVFILVVVVYKCTQERQRRNNRRPLNEMVKLEDPLYEEVNASSPSTQNSYSEIQREGDVDVLIGDLWTDHNNGDLDHGPIDSRVELRVWTVYPKDG